MEYITSSPFETKKIAKKLASQLEGGEVLCLYGELGAGKTVFAAGVINYFLPKKRVLSPTFIIVRHYKPLKSFLKNIFHVDLYRISKEADIRQLGLTDFMHKPDSLVLIEWADRLGKYLPKKRIDIYIKVIDENKRLFKIPKWQNG